MKSTRSVVLMMCALALAPSCLAQEGGNFFAGINYAAGITPQEIFNEVGGIGLGYEPGFLPVQTQVGDFDNDGKMDIVVAGGCTTTFSALCLNGYAVAVYIGKGDGTFQTPPIVNGAPQPSLRSIAVGDFNGDGNLDVIAASDSCQTGIGCVIVLFGDGRGNLSLGANYSFDATANYPESIAVADFNHDGNTDFAVKGGCQVASACKLGDGVVAVFLGTGSGAFTGPTIYDSGASLICISMVTGDFNGDGFPDLVVDNLISPQGNSASSISLYYGKGDGTFQAPVTTALSFLGVNVGALAVADFNSDGFADLVISHSSEVEVMFGNGNGTFLPPAAYSVTSYFPISIWVADFNSDGKPDMAVAGEPAAFSDSLNILLNDGAGSFHISPIYGFGGWNSAAVTAADFNGDGKADLALSTLCSEDSSINCQDGTISVLLGNGDGTMQSAAPANLTVYPHHMVLADLNGDGIQDVVGTEDCYQTNCQTRQSGVVVALGVGNGTFAAASEYPAGMGNNVASGIAVGDLNRDGKMDVVVGGNGVSILLGNGDGSLGAAVAYPTAENVIGPPGIGYFAGNGNPPGVAVLHQLGSTGTNASVSILLGNGDGTLQAEKITQVSELVGYQLTVGDFDRNGNWDVAVIGKAIALPKYSAFTVLLGNGDGTLTVKPDPFTNPPDDYLIVCTNNICIPLASYPTYGSVGAFTASGASITAADYTLDGILDITAASACVINDTYCSTGMIAGCLGKGDGTFFCGTVGHYPLPDANYLGVAVKDVTGDGLPDIVATTLTGVAVYPNGDHGGTVYAGRAIADSETPAIADLNGDNAADILVGDYTGAVILFNRFPAMAATATTVTSSANPSNYGASVTFTATVTSSSGTPTGTVTLEDGGTAIGTGTLNGGTTSFNTATLAVATHSITAVYGGASNYQASTSTPLSQVVNQAMTTMTLRSTPNPSTLGQLVTITAKLTSNGGVPTGRVTFTLGGKMVSANINGGKAVITTKALPKGKDKVKANYSGNADYSAASALVTQQVN